jgi:superfamily I DNA and/or RNA helicase
MPTRLGRRRRGQPQADRDNLRDDAALPLVCGVAVVAVVPAHHGRDVWYDVRSSVADGHWIPEEGEALQKVLSGLRDADIAASEIRVLSPFRQVFNEAAKKHRTVFPETTNEERKQWVGTVHVMQGKEADVVILVLGGDPNRPRARSFAVEAPNLLNVAVSRAKRRLYVIGNYETWGDERYFCELVHNIRLWRP